MSFGLNIAEVEEIVQAAHLITDGLVGDVKNQTDKLAGETPGEGAVVANWQSGTGTSGEAGADLVSIGTAGDYKKLHGLIVNIGNLIAGATITIKLFLSVNGVDVKVYPPVGTTWTPGTDPDGIWVVTGTLEITGVLRVEVQSNNAADNGRTISYKYDLEDM